MIALPLFSKDGAQSGTLDVDPAQYGGRVRVRLLAEAVVMYEARARQGTASARDLGTIAGSHKKLWRQKGTGRARIGHKRSAQRKGGASVFPPKPRNFSWMMPRKARRAALCSALLDKFLTGKTMVVEAMPVDDMPKTKNIANLLKKMGVERSCMIAIEEHNPVIEKSVRNLMDVAISSAHDLNAYTVLKPRFLILTRKAFDQLHHQTQAAIVRQAS